MAKDAKGRRSFDFPPLILGGISQLMRQKLYGSEAEAVRQALIVGLDEMLGTAWRSGVDDEEAIRDDD